MKAVRLFIKAAIWLFALVLSSHIEAQNNERRMNRFISSLMKRMTLNEKLGQLNLLTQSDYVTGEASNSDFEARLLSGEVGGVLNMVGTERIVRTQRAAVEKTRLGIPLLFGLDVIHGYRTIFPIPLAQSASWDIKAIKDAAATATSEATADGLNWTYSPMVDICQDARWGRIAEGAGEDPYLGSLIARAMVEGIQGDNSFVGDDKMASCIKHFALYGAASAGLDYNRANISRQAMYNEYFAPYKAAVDAGALSVMASFNEIEGIPATANRWLLTDLLRKDWRFKGMVVSDYTGVAELTAHGIGSPQTVACRAIEAGVDMDMVSQLYLTKLKDENGKPMVNIKTIDQACRRVLETKYRLGLFSDPYKFCTPGRESERIYTERNLMQAEELAKETFVLLKNDNRLLPLNTQQRVALIGPLADSHGELLGSWYALGSWRQTPSLREALALRLPADKFAYAKGCNIYYDEKLNRHASYPEFDHRSTEEMLQEALKIASEADIIIAAMGETAEMSGESSSRADISMPDAQKDLLVELKKLGKPIVLILFSGRPMAIEWEASNLESILEVWFPGSRGASAICSTLYGDNNPSGRLTCTFPRATGQEPMHYNHPPSGRPMNNRSWFSKFRMNYLDVADGPLYPFGYGLSYSEFKYGEASLTANQMKAGETITLSLPITNISDRDGTEIVQLYVRDPEASSTRPVKELKDFERVELRAGQRKTVSFKIDIEKLKFWDHDLKHVAEPGEFQVFVGPNSSEGQMLKFTLLP